MAQDDSISSQQAEAGIPFWRRQKWILFGGIGLLLMLLSAGGTFLAVKHFTHEDGEAGTQELDPSAAVKKPPAIYYPLKPPVVVDFSVRGRQRFLQAELTLLTREEDVIKAIELHQPMLRNALVLLIGGQTYDELQTAEGKELLRQACLQTLQKLLTEEIGKPGIEQVLFTNFVMQ